MIAAELEQLWNDYHFRIASYIGKRMKRQWGQDVINDLVSTVFLRAAVAMNNGNGATNNAGAWLFQIARSVIADHFRALQYKTFQSFDELWMEPCREPTPYEWAEQSILQDRIERAIQHLDGKQGDVIRMRLDGYEYDEIAQMLNKTHGAAKQLNVRAFQHLREWLGEVA